ncbi:LpqB family beta-propeller domain-containing protein [Thermostaphylospora chromogena]|uniref:LpqB family beta-propeller domain-containing protein n=1 Tax=Thermostaphylospora chromogena TaxID=35622 RepID=UPI00104216F2|nr:LpqB family beta-propeller domain-containing protein [Thermostaphylospora chromogena]
MAAALALVLSGSACAIIPMGGAPASYRDVVKGDPLRRPYVRVIAMPPRKEWTPRQVVAGFLSAMAAVDDPRYAVARQYLVEEAARTWRPEVGVTIYDKGTLGDQPPPAEDATEETVTLKGTVTGAIDIEGKYRAEATPQGRALEQSFRLVKQPQGWRITQVPDGLLLSEDDVRRNYRSVKLYYLDHRREGLVADEVRIPVNPSVDFAESMLRRLLEGPTSTLSDAVTNALPAGTELLGVSTEDDRIIVDLNSAATNAISADGGDGVEAMAAQIGWTLDQLTERWEIEIRVNGEPFYPSGGSLVVRYDDYGRYDRWLNPEHKPVYLVRDGALHVLVNEGEPEPVPGAAGRADELDPDVAISGSEPARVATLSGDRRSIDVAELAPNGQWARWITGTDLTRPSWDRYDNLWTVDRVGERESRVLRHDGTRQTRVAAPWLEAVGVREMRVARDGVRVAAIVEDEQGVHVRVGTILIKGSETRMVNPRTVLTAAEGEEIVDIVWRDATTLLVLTGGKAGRGLQAISVTGGVAETYKSAACINTLSALGDRVLAGARCAEDSKPQVLAWDATKQAWIPLLSASAVGPRLPLD